jgi:hypothetical protein
VCNFVANKNRFEGVEGPATFVLGHTQLHEGVREIFEVIVDGVAYASERCGLVDGLKSAIPSDGFDLLAGHLSVSVRWLTVRRILSLTEIQSSLKSSGAENNFCGRKWQRGKMFGTRHILDVGVNALKDCRSSNFVLAAFWE